MKKMMRINIYKSMLSIRVGFKVHRILRMMSTMKNMKAVMKRKMMNRKMTNRKNMMMRMMIEQSYSK
jgi:hypothetical protein